MTSKITISRRVVQAIVNSLKSKSILVRVDIDKDGYWEVISENED